MFTYTPLQSGNTSFSFRVGDDSLEYSQTRSVVITAITEPLNPPVLTNIINKIIHRNINYSFRAYSTNPKNQVLTWAVSTPDTSSAITRLDISDNGLVRFRRSSNANTSITVTVTDEDGLFDVRINLVGSDETFNINTISPPPITPPVIDPPVVVPPPPPDRIAPTIVVTTTTDTILQRYKTSIGADFAIYFIATDDGKRITDLSQFAIIVTNLPSGIF